LWNIKDVFSLLEQLPKLRFLNLSQNKITFSGTEDFPQYEQLEVLVWNFGDLSWKNIEYLVSCFPNLKELHVRDNEVECIEISDYGQWKNIQYLNLAGNKITDWSEVQKLSSLPKYVKLYFTK
jgi:Leucine-rich repeat (LRR) protein